ncbi:hypothetical protein JOF55_002206 [Haloactinomyces albus]|uniref:Uncharacterized protein n=1 Tax=Haloactinomyces albus TaxID=1352928 RepID=A0AAE3ZDR6_9ACTN|nr:hypothetical protein [Haloactinomyces albus]
MRDPTVSGVYQDGGIALIGCIAGPGLFVEVRCTWSH